MVEQVRIGAFDNHDSPWILEPVAGHIEAGHTPADTAERESLEEAGCTILALEPICEYLVSPGTSNERTTLFCGLIDNCEANSIHGLKEEAENIKVIELPVDRALALLAEGKIYAASAVICLQWLQINISNLKNKWQRISP